MTFLSFSAFQRTRARLADHRRSHVRTPEPYRTKCARGSDLRLGLIQVRPPRSRYTPPLAVPRICSRAQGTCGHCPDVFGAGCAHGTGRAHRSCSPGRSQVRPARAAPKGRPRPRLCMPCTQGMFGQPTDMLGAGGRSDFKELNVPPQLQPKISENVV